MILLANGWLCLCSTLLNETTHSLLSVSIYQSNITHDRLSICNNACSHNAMFVLKPTV
uniref:Uncharacterized protein n=1 Tax=Anguilla anguilla TaxID=7936 RepID=A0A0E9X8M2_ANGAN